MQFVICPVFVRHIFRVFPCNSLSLKTINQNKTILNEERNYEVRVLNHHRFPYWFQLSLNC